MKKIGLYGAIALLGTALVLPAIAAQPPTPTEVIKMSLTSKPVDFDHATHAAIDCGGCHHVINGAENYQKCSTAGCHDLLGQRENKSMNSYYRIAHERKTGEINSCLKCHIEVAGDDADLKKELTSCVGSACHPKPAG